MLDFTFLTEEQVFGANRLDIIRKRGAKCELTDFSIFSGGHGTGKPYNNGEQAEDDVACWWWLKTPYSKSVRTVLSFGSLHWNICYEGSGGARPAVSYSSISSLASNKVRGLDGILEVEYGEYPQTIVSEEFSEILEREKSIYSY